MNEPHIEIFKYEMIIKEQHLDTFGHVNNATYLSLLEEARWELVTARGFGLETIIERKMGPVILEVQMKFLKELRLRQKICIQTQALSYAHKIGTLQQKIFNEQGILCFEAQMSFGLFDTEKRKLLAPTPEWLYAIGLTPPSA